MHQIFLYLSNHDRENKNSHKVVDELKDHLKESGGFWDTPNSDQGLHSIVVTANVTEQREREETLEEFCVDYVWSHEQLGLYFTNLLPSPLYTQLVDPRPFKAEHQ